MLYCPVSVVIPTFNRGSLLDRAVASVMKQTVQCRELVIVDDGSTDNTQDYLQKLIVKDNIKLKIYRQENKGPAAARNLGIKNSQYDIIAFLDSDDHWHKRKLEYQYRDFAEKSDFLICHTKEKWLRRGVHLNQKKIHIPRNGDIFTHCLQLCAVGMSTVMVKKELFEKIGSFDEAMQCCEDYDIWLRASCNYPFLLVDIPLTIKEGGREDQVSCKYRVGMDKFRIYSLKKLLDSNVLNSEQYILAFKEFEKKVAVYGNGCLKHGNEELGNKYLELISVYKRSAAAKPERSCGQNFHQDFFTKI